MCTRPPVGAASVLLPQDSLVRNLEVSHLYTKLSAVYMFAIPPTALKASCG